MTNDSEANSITYYAIMVGFISVGAFVIGGLSKLIFAQFPWINCLLFGAIMSYGLYYWFIGRNK